MKNDRHYCACCGTKKYEKFMVKLWYPLIKKRGWSCLECYEKHKDYLAWIVSTSEDN